MTLPIHNDDEPISITGVVPNNPLAMKSGDTIKRGNEVKPGDKVDPHRGDLPPNANRTTPWINHEHLLRKYIAHVVDQEGVDFLGSWQRSSSFSNEEWSELVRLSNKEE